MSSLQFQYVDKLAMLPVAKPLRTYLAVPGSKSLTNRALVLGALASRNGACTLDGALRSEDTEVMIECLIRLGFRIHADWAADQVTIEKNDTGRIIPAHAADLFVANSGTTMRFLTAAVSLGATSAKLTRLAGSLATLSGILATSALNLR